MAFPQAQQESNIILEPMNPFRLHFVTKFYIFDKCNEEKTDGLGAYGYLGREYTIEAAHSNFAVWFLLAPDDDDDDDVMTITRINENFIIFGSRQWGEKTAERSSREGVDGR